MATLISILFVVLLSLAGASVYAATWLLYQLGVQVLIPLLIWLWREGEHGAERLHAWYRHVTWRWRVTRTRKRAIRQIEDVRREHVESLRMLAGSLDRLELPEIDKAEAVSVGARRGEATR